MRLERPDYVVLVVQDLDRAVAFYRDVLGLPLGHRSGPYAQFATGPTRLSLYDRDAMRETLGQEPAAFEIGFKVESCDVAYDEMVNAGATPVTPPTDRPWGQRTAYVRDPDGNLIELVEPTIPSTRGSRSR